LAGIITGKIHFQASVSLRHTAIAQPWRAMSSGCGVCACQFTDSCVCADTSELKTSVFNHSSVLYQAQMRTTQEQWRTTVQPEKLGILLGLHISL